MNPLVRHTIALTGKLLLVNFVLGFVVMFLIRIPGGPLFVLLLSVAGLAANVFLILSEVALLTRDQLAARPGWEERPGAIHQ